MGIHLKWYDDQQTIIYWRFAGRWTVDDLQAALQQQQALTEGAPHRYDLIANVEGAGLIPVNLMRFIRQLRDISQTGAVLQIVVGTDAYLRVFWEYISSMLPERWRQVVFLDSCEDAVKFIERDRATLELP